MTCYSIVDSNYTDEGHSGMASTWLRWELEHAEIPESSVADTDIFLMTVSSQQGVLRVKAECKKIRKLNRGAKIILGGGGCYGPAIFDTYADLICVGEGVEFIRSLLQDGYAAVVNRPEAWMPGDTRTVIPGKVFPWELPPLNHPDGTVRVFGSRGCRYSCLFCQTGWENTYRPNPYPDRLESTLSLLSATGRRLAIVTNDAAEENVRLKGQQEFISVTLHNTMKHLLPLTRDQTKSVRFGIEGVSERLRRAIGKPILSDDLVKTTVELLKNKIGIRWFFIPGLPGETDADWEELQYLVMEIKKYADSGAVMMNFHAYIPQPATPLGVLPLIDKYWERYDNFRTWFFHGMGFTRRVQLVNPARYSGRMERAQESMAATEAELRRGWFEHDNKNWRIKYNKPPDELRRLAKIYARRIGLNLEPHRAE